jgi:N-acetylglucosaminyldiphosphoundecaprenol N-acetyl-beta-D-mannosaminyltransferase
MRALTIKSVPIVVESKAFIRSKILDVMASKHGFFPIVTFNFTMIGAHPRALLSWLKQNALFVPDGIGICILLWCRYGQWVSRVPGIDLAIDILRHSQGLSIALIGASEASLLGSVAYLNDRFPSHRIVFFKNGYAPISKDDLAVLKAESPDLILVAKGCPGQEQFIQNLSHRLSFGVAMGVGGSFDVWSGKKKRAPKWAQYLGCEWLVRVIQEPSRCTRLWLAFVRLVGFQIK